MEGVGAFAMNPLRDLQNKWDRAARWYDIATAGARVPPAAVGAAEVGFRPRARSGWRDRMESRALPCRRGHGHHRSQPGRSPRRRRRGASKFAVMDAEHLALWDGLFDTVVPTLGTCTFLDPVEALGEMRRVCRRGGRILLLEHGRSDCPGIATWQDRRAPKHAACLDCW
jgi:SAM-dependent methyltransferase